jgi:sirohydrochlorin cobaltochelatase
MEKKALLVVSFGTSYPETRSKTIDVIEEMLKEKFPDRTFYRAWTSGMIRKKIKERDNMVILSVEEALDQMEKDGITDLLVQPTHLITGEEYDKIMNHICLNQNRFQSISLGDPLIKSYRDVYHLVRILESKYSELTDKDMLVFMGHGSARMEFDAYEELKRQFLKNGHGNYVIGTVEFTPGIEPVLEKVMERKPERVFLAPLLLVAGDHATNDMAGDEPDSWKSVFTEKGFQVSCVVKGLGEYKDMRSILVRHAMEALK